MSRCDELKQFLKDVLPSDVTVELKPSGDNISGQYLICDDEPFAVCDGFAQMRREFEQIRDAVAEFGIDRFSGDAMSGRFTILACQG